MNASAGTLMLTFASGRHAGAAFLNKGSGTVRFKVADGYGGHTRTLAVRAGATAGHTVGLRAGGRWCDLTVTCDAGPSFLHRFAQHVENGWPGVSDPAITTE